MRVGDLLSPDFRADLRRGQGPPREDSPQPRLRYDITELEKPSGSKAVEYLRRFRIIDSEYFVNDCLAHDKSILAEGAQGTLLDVDFGSYPLRYLVEHRLRGCLHRTGRRPEPHRRGLRHLQGLLHARVGSGPFPTELFDQTGEKLCDLGHEFGAVTGRAAAADGSIWWP